MSIIDTSNNDKTSDGESESDHGPVPDWPKREGGIMTQENGQNEDPDEIGGQPKNDDTVIGNLAGGVKSPDETVKRKAFGTGYELWVGLAIGFYVVYAVTELIAGFVHSEIEVPLRFDSDAVATLDFPTSTATLSGLTQITVSTPDLAAATMVLLLIAKIAFILTFLGSAIAIVPVIRDIAAGTPFTGRSIKALYALEWVVAMGWLLYFVTMLLGSNMVTRDLDITEEVNAGITTMQAFLVLGVLGGAELLRRCFKSGRAAQSELEGLI